MLASTAPTTREGIEKYLGSGMVKGIGPVYAKKLVEKFGEKISDIIEQEHCFKEMEPIFSLTESEEQFLNRLRSLTGDLVAFAPVHDVITVLADALLKRETLSAEESTALAKEELGMS